MAKKEKKPASLVQRLMDLFAGSDTAHGTHGEPIRAPDSLKWEIKKTARTLRGAATLEMWQQHTDGTRPLGVIMIRSDSKSKFGSIDYDVYNADLLEIIAIVEKLRLPLVPCRSKSGGLHLFLFLKEWTSALAIQTVLRDLAAQLGIAGSEIFPKQTEVLTDRGDMGNWMCMPYLGTTYDGKIADQYGLKKNGAEMTLAEFVSYAESAMVTEEQLQKLVRKRVSSKMNGAHQENDVPFGDGPPCLETLADTKVPQGQQNNTLMHMGVYFKKKHPTGWEKQLEHAAKAHLDPPGSAEGTASVIKSLKKKDYQYMCKTEPMCKHCNAALCRTRRYGIGEEGNYPSLSGLAKIPSDPPIWFVTVQGTEHRLEMSTEQLQNYLLFHRICMGKLNKTYRNMKQADWFVVVSEAMDKGVTLELEDSLDLTTRSKFVEMLEEFCTNRQRGDKREDILHGRPWLSDGDNKYYFRLRDFERFLSREGVKDWTRGQIASKIKDMKGGKQFFNIKGRGAHTWWVEKGVIEEMPQLDTPGGEEEGV